MPTHRAEAANLLSILVQENLKAWSGLNVQMFGLSVNSWEELAKAESSTFLLAKTHLLFFYVSSLHPKYYASLAGIWACVFFPYIANFFAPTVFFG